MTAACWRPETAPGCNLLKMQASLSLCKLAIRKACESGDQAHGSSSASQCILQQQLPNSEQTLHSAPKASRI